MKSATAADPVPPMPLFAFKPIRLALAVFSFVGCFAVQSGSALAQPHLLLDLDNGKVLSHQQAFDPWHPASLTKVMTAYVIFEAIRRGEVALDDTVRVSKTAARQPPSKMGYAPGTVLSVESALKLLIVKSANDIAVALAEHVGGSVDGFAAMANAEARRLGMTGSTFANPHGLHDARQVITARDFGILLLTLHRDHARYRDWFSAPGLVAQKRNKQGKLIDRVYYSYNLLLERYRGADGFKTGFVCASGYNYAGSATRAGRRLAAIVLGRDSQTSRAVDAAKLLSGGFEQPAGAGTPLSELRPTGETPAAPRNMRSVMCSEAARNARYEPGAGLAVIDSPWLQKRTKQAIALRAPLASAALVVRVPLPVFRPDIPSLGVDKTPDAAEPISVAERMSPRLPPGLTVPTFRPAAVN